MPKKNKTKRIKKFFDKIKKNKIKFKLTEVIVIIIVALSLGVLLGSFLTYGKEKILVNRVPSELEEFVTTYNSIIDTYYKKVDKNKLVDAAIEGMVNSLEDPHSNYMNKDVTEVFNQSVDGEYDGIGVAIQINDDNLEVLEIFKDTPAAKVLKKGDKIIEVSGKKVTKKNYEKILDLIKKKGNGNIKMKIIRDEKEMEVETKRERIAIPSVSSKVIKRSGKKIGYIEIDIFAANTYEQFKTELEKIEKDGIDSLIIDVRGNSGGHLDQVTKIVELFLNKKKIIYQLETKGVKKKVYSTTDEKRKYKIAVLINKASASASELLTAAMKESYGAAIVGTNSYGKGTIQNAYQLKDGTSLKYTTQKWLTPKGNWINEKGVEPTLKVELSDDYVNNPIEDNDNQLQEALDLLAQ